MTAPYRLPDRGEPVIAVTSLMRRMESRTLAAIPGGGLCVWSGPSGIGKTATARWLHRAVSDSYSGDDDSCYRSLYYEVGGISANSGNQQKQGIRSLYLQVLKAPLLDPIYKRSPAEALAELVVHGMMRRNLRLLFIDEAGCLSTEALRGMVLVNDLAANRDWHSSLVFIGMDDLPQKIEALPQLSRRIEAWCYFEEYSLDETARLLAALHPHFRAPKCSRIGLDEEVAYIHKHFGGLPGAIVPFLRQVDAYLSVMGSQINLAVLRATHEVLKRDHDRAIEDSKNSYARRALQPVPKQSPKRAGPLGAGRPAAVG